MRIIIVILALLITNLQKIHAQFVYPNDICTGAKPLLVGNTGELNDSVFQRNYFADNAISPLPNCAGASNVRNDLWYSFIAPDVTVAVVPEYYIGFYQLFSGNCGTLTSMACSDGSTFPPLTGLIPGQQYYLRTYSGGSAANYKLNLLSKPVNDVCANAVMLPVNPLQSQSLPLKRFTNELATETTDNSCGNITGGWTGYEDVWFKFIAANAAHSVYIEAPSTNTRVAVYTGAPGSFTAIGSLFNSSPSITQGLISLTNLTPGQTYHIRAAGSSIVKFNLSITTGVPKNDDCPNADTVLMSSSFNCEKLFSFRRISATTSTAPCATSSPNDVWFIFQATVPDITVKGLGEYATGIKLGLLSGSCGSLSCLVNSATPTLNYSGLTVGNYYYLKVGGNSFLDKNFSICIAPRITNDECSGAITVPVKPYNILKTMVGNVDGATSSMLSCSGQPDEDVWFKFTATDTACIITADGETAYPNFQVLSGNCGALTSVHCSSENALPTNVFLRTEKVRGLIPGNVYYVKYMPSNGGGFFTLDINGLPPNDECAGAITLTPKTGLAYEVMANNGALEAATSMPPCINATYTNDIWYKFTATATSAAIVSDQLETINPTFNSLGFQVFGGSCGALNSIVCFEQGTAKHKAQTLTGLTPGQTYYVRQYGNYSKNTVGILNPPVNDEMSGAVKLVPAPVSVQAMPSYYLHGASKQFGKICAGSPSTIHHDVWFYFIAEAASHIISVNSFNSFWEEQIAGYTYRLEAFRGYATDSTSLVSKFISCAATSLTLNSLTAGDTVYVRVSNTSAANNTSIFSMKVTNAQNIDEPSGALTLTKTDGYQYSLTTAGATQSLPANGCSIADFPDDDIWLKFSAAADVKRVIAGFENRDITIQLFSGTPGNLTHVKCSNNIMLLPANLINGEVYYLRMYSKASALSAQFQVGLFGEPNMLANDCAATSCLGPNLVANPACESEYEYLLPQLADEPGFPGRKLAEGWWSGNRYTPDAWDADYPGGWANIPGNTVGSRSKIPRSGKGMLGILNAISISWHEYVSGKLTQPLVQGKTYLVSFYVSVASESFDRSIPAIGAYFSNDSLIGEGAPVEFLPHIRNTPGEPVTEINGWRNICGLFYADKPYSFITIGVFGPSNIFNTVAHSYFYIDDVVVADTACVALPVTLLNFRGKTNGQKQSELSWEATEEVNLARYDIEWRTDGTSFSKIGTVQARSNSSAVHHYDFLHTTAADGYNLYRLKMIDKDGKFSYSSIVRIGNKSNGGGLTVFPNPVTSMLNLNVQAERDEMVLFSLFQTDGRVVATKQEMIKKGTNAFNWNVGNLAAGIYFIRSTDRNFKTVKITKQ